MDESSRFPPLRIVEESTRRLFILLSNCASSKALSTAKPYIPKNNGKVERANGLIKQGTTKRHRYKTLNKWKMTCGTGLYITTFAEDIEASIIHLMKVWKSGLAKIRNSFTLTKTGYITQISFAISCGLTRTTSYRQVEISVRHKTRPSDDTAWPSRPGISFHWWAKRFKLHQSSQPARGEHFFETPWVRRAR